MKILIKVTKEILERSKMCGIEIFGVPKNCAVALAIRDLFPNASVHCTYISFDDRRRYTSSYRLPIIAIDFIGIFDLSSPDERVKMSPISLYFYAAIRVV